MVGRSRPSSGAVDGFDPLPERLRPVAHAVLLVLLYRRHLFSQRSRNYHRPLSRWICGWVQHRSRRRSRAGAQGLRRVKRALGLALFILLFLSFSFFTFIFPRSFFIPFPGLLSWFYCIPATPLLTSTLTACRSLPPQLWQCRHHIRDSRKGSLLFFPVDP